MCPWGMPGCIERGGPFARTALTGRTLAGALEDVAEIELWVKTGAATAGCAVTAGVGARDADF